MPLSRSEGGAGAKRERGMPEAGTSGHPNTDSLFTRQHPLPVRDSELPSLSANYNRHFKHTRNFREVAYGTCGI